MKGNPLWTQNGSPLVFVSRSADAVPVAPPLGLRGAAGLRLGRVLLLQLCKGGLELLDQDVFLEPAETGEPMRGHLGGVAGTEAGVLSYLAASLMACWMTYFWTSTGPFTCRRSLRMGS